jgi:MraZ protein
VDICPTIRSVKLLKLNMSKESEKEDEISLPIDGKVHGNHSFYGNHTHLIDEKGRVSLPVQFRRVLETSNSRSVILTNYVSDGARCLEGFSLKNWGEFESRLRAKSRFSAKLHKLENFYLSRASECPLDSNGRILLPQHLRMYAGLAKEVTFTASIHGFRVWDKRVWEHVFASAESALAENPDLFADVDL